MSRLKSLLETRSKINAEIDFLSAAQDNRGTEPALANDVNCCEQTAREKSAEEVIADLFTYHPPKSRETEMNYETVRDAAKHLALVIWKACPYGPDRTAAIRKLREAVMTANAAIALEGRSI